MRSLPNMAGRFKDRLIYSTPFQVIDWVFAVTITSEKFIIIFNHLKLTVESKIPRPGKDRYRRSLLSPGNG